MNEEQSKRLADAAEAILNATDALDEAREALGDRRFDSEQERERTQAIQQVSNRLDNAGKRVEDSLRKAVVAAATLGREGSYERYRAASAASREGRMLAKTATDQDGTLARRQRAEEALSRLDLALATAAALLFGD